MGREVMLLNGIFQGFQAEGNFGLYKSGLPFLLIPLLQIKATSPLAWRCGGAGGRAGGRADLIAATDNQILCGLGLIIKSYVDQALLSSPMWIRLLSFVHD
ncbi:hypothetical protein SDJN03_06814, partial [Cucurbita argyrosperma subsp. sororia]